MGKYLKWLAYVPPVLLGLMFLVQGIMTLVAPARALKSAGIDIPDGGLALSSLVGLNAGFALSLSLCLAIALRRRERLWYYPPIMMFVFLGVGRVVATVHGAAFLPERFIPEFAFAGLLYLSSIHATKEQA